MTNMELIVLGSGTSHGIPVIGCNCEVCLSKDPKDNRMRASALIKTDNGKTILIDAGPEFRLQALREKIENIDALLVTHPHADHIHGLDDLRIFTYEHDLNVYAEHECIEEIKERFAYIFKETQNGGGKPRLALNAIQQPITVCGLQITPIPILHGKLVIYGWKVENTAYLTDCSCIPEKSYELLSGIKNLVIDGLREKAHSTHFTFSQAIESAWRIGAQNTYITHICHDFSHTSIQKWISNNKTAQQMISEGKKIEPAFDGLHISMEKSDT